MESGTEFSALWVSPPFKPYSDITEFLTALYRSEWTMREVKRYESGMRVCLILKSGTPCRFSELGNNAIFQDYYKENSGRWTFDGRHYWKVTGLVAENKTQHIYFDLEIDPHFGV